MTRAPRRPGCSPRAARSASCWPGSTGRRRRSGPPSPGRGPWWTPCASCSPLSRGWLCTGGRNSPRCTTGSTPIVGAKHPWALGRPYKEVFPEVWAHPVSSHFHYVTDTRKPLLVPDEPLIMERHGFLEQCYFDSAFQPVLLDDGTAGGVLQILTETTGRVLGERRLRLLSETGARTAGLPTPGEVARVVAEVAGLLPRRDPVLGLYLASEPGMQRPAASAGLRSAPETVSLSAADGPEAAARLAQVVADGAPATLPAAAFTGGSTAGQHAAAPRLPVEQALALPLHCAGQVEGVLVVGVNPCFPPAGAYQDFLEVLASAVAGALSAALAPRRAAPAGGGAGRAGPGQDHLLRQRQPRVPHPAHPAPGPAPAGPGRRGPARAARAAGAGRARRPAPAEAGQHPPGRRPGRGRAGAGAPSSRSTSPVPRPSWPGCSAPPSRRPG